MTDNRQIVALRRDHTGRVFAGGCSYEDRPSALRAAAREWRACARSVSRETQQECDPMYRLMGRRAANYRLAIARALEAKAQEPHK